MSAAPPDPRRVAIDALVRIDRDGAYANLVLPKVLARSGLGERDRAFVTQLVYGTTRYRRACDWFVDRWRGLVGTAEQRQGTDAHRDQHEADHREPGLLHQARPRR